MKFTTLFTSVTAASALLLAGTTVASAESTLEIVKKRGHLRCQVGQPSAGYYNMNADGNWYGLDVQNCHAVAAAIFGDKDKLEI
ncbi:MAG: general L-amino acid transport system substrate-binding protein [Parasphingorhabdus sp.]|jgi:general L-amino acid transport system substrate-binding protein